MGKGWDKVVQFKKKYMKTPIIREKRGPDESMWEATKKRVTFEAFENNLFIALSIAGGMQIFYLSEFGAASGVAGLPVMKLVIGLVWFISTLAGYMGGRAGRPYIGILMIGASIFVFSMQFTGTVGVSFFGPYWTGVERAGEAIFEPMSEAMAGMQQTFGDVGLLMTCPNCYFAEVQRRQDIAKGKMKAGGTMKSVELVNFEAINYGTAEPIIDPMLPLIGTIDLENKGEFDALNVKVELLDPNITDPAMVSLANPGRGHYHLDRDDCNFTSCSGTDILEEVPTITSCYCYKEETKTRFITGSFLAGPVSRERNKIDEKTETVLKEENKAEEKIFDPEPPKSYRNFITGMAVGEGETTSVCGNGKVERTEDCDDENTNDVDGCSSVCIVEDGYICTGEPSVCTKLCGNGVIDAGEVCDIGSDTTAGTDDKLDNKKCEDIVYGAENKYVGGELKCSANCESFDETGCNKCGNNKIDSPEQCDGTAFGNPYTSDCSSYTNSVIYVAGTLKCYAPGAKDNNNVNIGCTFDTRDCISEVYTNIPISNTLENDCNSVNGCENGECQKFCEIEGLGVVDVETVSKKSYCQWADENNKLFRTDELRSLSFKCGNPEDDYSKWYVDESKPPANPDNPEEGQYYLADCRCTYCIEKESDNFNAECKKFSNMKDAKYVSCSNDNKFTKCQNCKIFEKDTFCGDIGEMEIIGERVLKDEEKCCKSPKNMISYKHGGLQLDIPIKYTFEYNVSASLGVSIMKEEYYREAGIKPEGIISEYSGGPAKLTLWTQKQPLRAEEESYGRFAIINMGSGVIKAGREITVIFPEVSGLEFFDESNNPRTPNINSLINFYEKGNNCKYEGDEKKGKITCKLKNDLKTGESATGLFSFKYRLKDELVEQKTATISAVFEYEYEGTKELSMPILQAPLQ